jgi:hypothetical protein
MAIPTKPDSFHPMVKPVYPFEMDSFKARLFEIFEKTITLRTDFQKSLKNPSVKESEKVALRKCMRRLDYINKQLMDIPDYLEIFSVEK